MSGVYQQIFGGLENNKGYPYLKEEGKEGGKEEGKKGGGRGGKRGGK